MTKVHTSEKSLKSVFFQFILALCPHPKQCFQPQNKYFLNLLPKLRFHIFVYSRRHKKNPKAFVKRCDITAEFVHCLVFLTMTLSSNSTRFYVHAKETTFFFWLHHLFSGFSLDSNSSQLLLGWHSQTNSNLGTRVWCLCVSLAALSFVIKPLKTNILSTRAKEVLFLSAQCCSPSGLESGVVFFESLYLCRCEWRFFSNPLVWTG